MEFEYQGEGDLQKFKRKFSKEYINFLLEEQRAMEIKSWYEKYCRFAEKLKFHPPKKLEEKFAVNIVFSSLNVTPTGIFSASILTLLLSAVVFLIFSFFTHDATVLIFVGLFPFIGFWYILTYPSFIASIIKVQAGDEAIKVILYMVIYLKLNPSLEGAANFAAQHAKGPITNDIKKAMWDLEVGKYTTLEEALGKYMPKWAAWNEDFVRSMSLVYGVLIEPTEEGREEILKKSLSFILESTHSKMKRYVEEIASPIAILHVMGLTMPALGIILFPMVSIFLQQQVSIPQIIFGYTVLLPLLNLFFAYRILVKRPGAFLAPDISAHPNLPSENYFSLNLFGKKVLLPIHIFAILVGLLIMSYGIFHFVDLFTQLAVSQEVDRGKLLEREAEITPANLLSSFSITMGFAVAMILYFHMRSAQRIKIRNDIKTIESDYRIGLFTLGNFLSEGYPIEVSLQKALDEYKKLGMDKRPTYIFFQKIYQNMQNLGLTFRSALLHKEHGVLKYYPSVLIEEVTKILSDAAEKSAVLLGTIAKRVATYLENLFAIEDKIRELLEDTRASIKMQASFVVPLVTGIISILGIFTLTILRVLSVKLGEMERSLGLTMLSGSSESISGFMNILVGNFSRVVPMTLLQAVIGIYTVEVIAMLSFLLSGIENGFDTVARDYEISRSLIRGMILYVLVSFVSMFIFYGMLKAVEFGVV